MLAHPREILKKAGENGYAVGAFNVFNLETAKAVVEASEELNSPVIVQTSESEAAFAGIENIASLVKLMVEKTKAPVILNFDHGKKVESLERAIKAGYTSVMIDASEKPLEENIALTKKIVELARSRNVWVEAELGVVPTPNQSSKFPPIRRAGKVQSSKFFDKNLTDVDEAVRFVEETKVDALAVAIGNKHGFYKGEPKIDFTRLEELRSAVNIPLVLHGGSGIADSDIRRAIELGIVKINVNTELRIAFVKQLRKSLAGEELRKPHEVMEEVMEAVKIVVKDKIKLFSNNFLKLET